MNRPITIEICANSIESAIAAQKGGAHRVELCENLPQGGTTPSYGQIHMARQLPDIKLNVLIRPRAGDFLYSDMEFAVMQRDIEMCINAGCDGIVIGILHANGSIDTKRCATLADMAKAAGLTVTFHRAFDRCANMYEALEEIIDMGCDRILTSGGKATASDGVDAITKLVKEAGSRIIIMPGSGISSDNAQALIQQTGVREIHASAKAIVTSKMQFTGNKLHSNDLDSSFEATNPTLVKALVDAIN